MTEYITGQMNRLPLWQRDELAETLRESLHFPEEETVTDTDMDLSVISDEEAALLQTAMQARFMPFQLAAIQSLDFAAEEGDVTVLTVSSVYSPLEEAALEPSGLERTINSVIQSIAADIMRQATRAVVGRTIQDRFDRAAHIAVCPHCRAELEAHRERARETVYKSGGHIDNGDAEGWEVIEYYRRLYPATCEPKP